MFNGRDYGDSSNLFWKRIEPQIQISVKVQVCKWHLRTHLLTKYQMYVRFTQLALVHSSQNDNFDQEQHTYVFIQMQEMYFQSNKWMTLGREPGLVVMGGDSLSEGHEFESQHRTYTGHIDLL